jgi:hypothetical protein
VTLTAAGLVFAVYLVVLQLAVIDAVCEWCVANDALLVALALLAAFRARPAEDLAPPGERPDEPALDQERDDAHQGTEERPLQPAPH